VTEQLAEKTAEVERSVKQIASLEATISARQPDSALRPLYEALNQQYSDLKAKFEAQSEELTALKVTAEKVDIGTDPVTTAKPSRAKKAKKGRSKKNTASTILPEELELDMSLASSASLDSIAEAPPAEPAPPAVPEEAPVPAVEKPPPLSQAPVLRAMRTMTKISWLGHIDPSIGSQRDSRPRKLPENYRVPDGIIDSADEAAMLGYVDRLFPLPFVETSNANRATKLFVQPAAPSSRVEIKTLSWTLRQIILIMRNGFEVDSFVVPGIQFMDIMEKAITVSGKHASIVDRIVAHLNRSVAHWRTKSNAVQFFSQFLNGEFGISEFRFFNMLFSLCFNAIYPPIDDILEDSQLSDDFNLFFIHRQFFDSIAMLLLRLDAFPDKNMQAILMNIPLTDYPDLIPFWTFAREMLQLFREAHARFHQQSRNILKIVGGSTSETIGRDRFTDFMRIINPLLRDPEIKAMWEKLSILDNVPGRTEFSYQALLRFCGEYPGISRWIGEMPHYGSFDDVFSAMPVPTVALFFFMRRRFTDYLPKFFEALTPQIQEALTPYLLRMRNSFLNCESSTCLMCYRYIMQYVDLKLTEMSPFQVLMGNVTTSDVARVINHLMMRECLATLLLKVKFDTDPDQIIETEANANKDNRSDSASQGSIVGEASSTGSVRSVQSRSELAPSDPPPSEPV
jgi:hypothetical protein